MACPDVVRHGEAGYLIPFGDLDRLAGFLGGLIDDPALAKSLGAVGRKLVERGHTWEDRFATLEGRTVDLIARRKPRGPHRLVASTSSATRD